MNSTNLEDSPYTLLILLSGNDAPGVTEALFSALAPFAAEVLDIEQVVIKNRLILTSLIRIDRAHARAIESDLVQAAEKLGLDIALDFSDSPSLKTERSNLFLVAISPNLKPLGIAEIASKIVKEGGNIDRIRRTASYPLTAIEFEVSIPTKETDLKRVQREIAEIASSNGIDIAIEQGGLSRRSKRIVILDMDSTLIQEEVIDLLATHAGVGEQVSAITERAMRGELDFSQSLAERVSLLTGLDESLLTKVAREITLTPGARTLIRTLHRLGHKVGVVSGGFLDVIEPLLKELKIDFYQANRLEIVSGKLTGKLTGKIIDKGAKAEALKEFAKNEKVNLSQTIAIGDGANDLAMIEIAGLGIAFNAKPSLQAVADARINSPYLDSVLYLMGITREEIEKADAD